MPPLLRLGAFVLIVTSIVAGQVTRRIDVFDMHLTTPDSRPTCPGLPVMILIDNDMDWCQPMQCSNVGTNLQQVSCSQTPVADAASISLPTAPYAVSMLYSTQDCSGDPVILDSALATGQCYALDDWTYMRAICGDDGVSLEYCSDAACSEECQNSGTDSPGGCEQANGSSYTGVAIQSEKYMCINGPTPTLLPTVSPTFAPGSVVIRTDHWIAEGLSNVGCANEPSVFSLDWTGTSACRSEACHNFGLYAVRETCLSPSDVASFAVPNTQPYIVFDFHNANLCQGNLQARAAFRASASCLEVFGFNSLSAQCHADGTLNIQVCSDPYCGYSCRMIAARSGDCLLLSQANIPPWPGYDELPSSVSARVYCSNRLDTIPSVTYPSGPSTAPPENLPTTPMRIDILPVGSDGTLNCSSIPNQVILDNYSSQCNELPCANSAQNSPPISCPTTAISSYSELSLPSTTPYVVITDYASNDCSSSVISIRATIATGRCISVSAGLHMIAKCDHQGRAQVSMCDEGCAKCSNMVSAERNGECLEMLSTSPLTPSGTSSQQLQCINYQSSNTATPSSVAHDDDDDDDEPIGPVMMIAPVARIDAWLNNDSRYGCLFHEPTAFSIFYNQTSCRAAACSWISNMAMIEQCLEESEPRAYAIPTVKRTYVAVDIYEQAACGGMLMQRFGLATAEGCQPVPDIGFVNVACDGGDPFAAICQDPLCTQCTIFKEQNGTCRSISSLAKLTSLPEAAGLSARLFCSSIASSTATDGLSTGIIVAIVIIVVLIVAISVAFALWCCKKEPKSHIRLPDHDEDDEESDYRL